MYCPKCDNYLTVTAHHLAVRCDVCNTHFYIDRDAEFEDGRWRDRTKLYELDPNEE